MSFVLTRFKERIVINLAFGKSLANELESNHFFSGTILLAANEIVFDPTFTFNYNFGPFARFGGRYHIILVADHIDSRGGKIDLSGSNGSNGVPDPGEHGTDPPRSQGDDPGAPGGVGFNGVDGGLGGHGMNIKIFVGEVKNIKIISDGGVGGKGGMGGRGGHGGQAAPGATPPRQGRGGKGGTGGKGGDGGNGGKIEVLFCNKSNGFIIGDHLSSKGGNSGIRGQGGFPGSGSPPPNLPGREGGAGIRGAFSEINVKKVGFSELWERVSIELAIPA